MDTVDNAITKPVHRSRRSRVQVVGERGATRIFTTSKFVAVDVFEDFLGASLFVELEP